MGAPPRTPIPHLRHAAAWRPHVLVLVLVTLPVLAEMGVHNGASRNASAAGLARAPIAADRSAVPVRANGNSRLGAITLTQSADGTKAPHTILIDVPTGRVIDDLQRFTIWRDGARLDAADARVADVAFTADANLFYASVTTGGHTYRARGDLERRALTITEPLAK